MRFALDTLAPQSWTVVSGAASTHTSVNITPGEGRKRVWAQFSDGTLNSPWVSDTIHYDITSPTVTINQASNQADPASTLPIRFTVTFSEPVTGFAADDITWSGTATPVSSVTISGSGAGPYTVNVGGATANGTITATIAANRAVDRAGNNNVASTSTDNTVTYSSTIPAGTITAVGFNNGKYTNQTNPIINVTHQNATQMQFSLNTQNASATLVPVASTYNGLNISTGGQGRKTVWARFYNGAIYSAWISDTIHFDNVAPTVTINQASNQADPTNALPIRFTATFSEPVTGFAADDITWSGTAIPVSNVTISGSGAGPYTVSVGGVSANGTITAAIAANRAVDRAGNNNLASTSTDNTVTYENRVAPTITSISPTRTVILAGQSAGFTVQATGTATLTYRWEKLGTGLVGSDNPQFTLTSATLADSGRYRCEVWNAMGSAVSAICTLVVLQPVKAAFGHSPQSAPDSATVTFTDQSTGSIERWRWDFGDPAAGAQNIREYTTGNKPTTPITFRYSRTGQYVVTLVVTGAGPAGVDTVRSAPIVIYARTNNPLKISGRPAPGAKVQITIDSAKHVGAQIPDPLPHADSIGVWFSRTGLPVDTTRPPLRKFRTGEVKATAAYTATLDVPAPASAADTVYGFWASPIWNANGKPSLYSDLNAVRVRMAPGNQLAVKGAYLGNKATLPAVDPDAARIDSATITVTNMRSIDTVLVNRLMLSYTLAGTPRQDTLSGQSLRSAVTAGQYVWRVHNPLFLSDTQRVVASVFPVAHNNLSGPAVRDTFLTGWPAPVNPCTLSVVPGQTRATKISLRWTPAGTVDSIRILRGTTQIPLGRPVLAGYELLFPSANQTTIDVAGLTKETRYFFGIQVFSNRQWSNITTFSRATDSTTALDPNDLVENTATIDSAWFDPETNRFRVRWNVTQVPGIDLDLGIVTTLDSSEAMSREPEANYGRVISVGSSTSGETVVDPGSGLRFDSRYHITLWLRSSNGPWAKPSPAGYRSVPVPAFTWQAVTFFNPRETVDTVTAFNGNVLLRKDAAYTYPVPTDDTVQVYQPQTLPEGFTAVSTGFLLRRYSDLLQPFYIGIRYDSIPSGTTAQNLGIYRDSAGVIVAVHGSFVDPDNRIVWVKTNDFHADDGTPIPFVVLADHRRPVITVHSDTASAVKAFTAVYDTIRVVDNVRNVAWTLWYARGGDPFGTGPSASGVICATCPDERAQIQVKIPDNLVTDETGVRVRLIISDGANRDTLDLSRRTQRHMSDAVTTTPMEWVPLSATAQLDAPEVGNALRDLSPGVPWQYNINSFRLVTWYPADGDTGRFVEYADGLDDLFRFDPGRIIWIKTRNHVSLNLGNAATLPPKGLHEVSLPPRAWSDFGSPYRFDVELTEVLKASGPQADSLELYAWERGEGGTYQTQTLFVGRVPGLDNKDQILPSIAPTGYTAAFTVFNPTNQPILLRIPPVSAAMSAAQQSPLLPKKSGQDGDWSIRVVSRLRTGALLNTVYCGQRRTETGTSYHPRAPSFSPVSVGVWDSRKTRLYGHAVTHGSVRGGVSYDLAFVNSSDKTAAITCRLETVGQIPKNYEAGLLNPTTGRFEEASPDALTVTVAPGEREERILVVGTSEYLRERTTQVMSGKVALLGCLRNPFRGAVMIRYSLPAIGVREVRFTVHDMRGRTLWHLTRKEGLSGGVHTLSWDGKSLSGTRLPAGVYTLSMIAYDGNGKSVGVNRMRLTGVW